jgi:hypothetical protein
MQVTVENIRTITPQDPFDRALVAQALVEGITLLTTDATAWSWCCRPVPYGSPQTTPIEEAVPVRGRSPTIL